MLLKKDFEGVLWTILIQDDHRTRKLDSRSHRSRFDWLRAGAPSPTFSTASTHSGHRDAFAQRTLRNIWPDRAGHSGLMLASRITLLHFSVSAAMSLAKSEDEPVTISLPNSAIRAFTIGSARAALTSRLIRSTISAGVPFGTPIP